MVLCFLDLRVDKVYDVVKDLGKRLSDIRPMNIVSQ